MAKVTGPLMSMDASGTLGGAIVFSKWKGIPVVRQWVKPANPNTAGQQAVRAVFQKATQLYKALSGADVAAWARRAAGLKMSGYNLLVKVYSAVAMLPTDMGLISDVSSTVIAAGSSTISFTVDSTDPIRISFGANAATPDQSVDVASPTVGVNTQAITGLNPAVTYYFHLATTAAAPTVAESGVYVVGA